MTAIAPPQPGSNITPASTGPADAPSVADGAAPLDGDPGAFTASPPGADRSTASAALAITTALIEQAASSQGGLAGLLADLDLLVAKNSPATPQPVLDAATGLLGLRLDLGARDNVSAGAVKSAMQLAGLVTAEEAAMPAAGRNDITSALATLRQALQSWLSQSGDATAPDTASSEFAARAAGPAIPLPPFAGAPTVAQSAAPPSIDLTAAPRLQALHLLAGSDAAISRQTLLHISSLSLGMSASQSDSAARGARLICDIPVITAEGNGVMQMAVEREASRRGTVDPSPTWRAKFSVDIEPLGPVHIQVVLASGRASITLNAERAESLEALAGGLPALEAGLREAALEPGDLRCRAGAPRMQPASPGTFLDRAT